jgi:hypothetical protein
MRKAKWLVLWNVIITALLLSALAIGTTPAQADNVRVFAANGINDDGADGSSATVDDVIQSTTTDPLVAISTTGLSAKHSHICVVTASAEATFAGNGIYVFGIGLDGGAPVEAADRRIEMADNPGVNDDDNEEVSTTIAFPGLVGDHTFTFSARKSSAGNGDLLVSASSMTAVCTKKDV